jgi:hypothetical protein
VKPGQNPLLDGSQGKSRMPDGVGVQFEKN